MHRFKRRPVAAAVLMLFSAPPLAMAQTQTQPQAQERALPQSEQTLPEVRVRGARSVVVLPGGPPDPIWAFLARLASRPRSAAPPLGQPLAGTSRLVVGVDQGAA